MPVIGDPQKLGQLARTIQRLSEVPARAAKRAATVITKMLRQSYDAQATPYGRAWAGYTDGSIKRGRRPPMLIETRASRRGLMAIPTAGAGIRIVFPTESKGRGGSPGYLRYHAFGTKHMVAREFLPMHGFPAKWREALDAITKEEFRKP